MKIAVVIPLYKHFSNLDIVERISLEQTYKVLYSYDICFVTHKAIDTIPYCDNKSLSINCKRFDFDESFFANIPGYNRLLLNYDFYKAFEDYDYMLICQLDVFVFSDRLAHFVKLNYDYIGGPWFEGYTLATENSKIIGSGNGGFSLRKVKSFLTVLSIAWFFNRDSLSLSNLKDIILSPKSFMRVLMFSRSLSRYKDSSKSIFPWEYLEYRLRNEDIYWSELVNKFFYWFKVAGVTDSIPFAFEVNPSILYELNGNNLPMAAHAWHKYDTQFWKPFLEERGYNVNI